ncbi:hypothetical protein [Arthrobacter sp. SAFR-014]|uniref:hypothetical protein n=1 Tax=unclassified Arthrobacter TaxID=235627 RepID=UPI003F7B98C2
MSDKDDALRLVASTNAEAAEAEAVAAEKQAARRAAVRAAFQAGCTAPEVGRILSVTPQRAYQIRDSGLQQTA